MEPNLILNDLFLPRRLGMTTDIIWWMHWRGDMRLWAQLLRGTAAAVPDLDISRYVSHGPSTLHVNNWIRAKGTCLQAEQTTGNETARAAARPSAEAPYWVMAKWWAQTLSCMFGIQGTQRAVERSWESSRGREKLRFVHICPWSIWPPHLA